MATLTKYAPLSEKELHIIIQKEIDAVEEGLRLLQYEYPSGKGILDFLCIDSGGRLVIIEVKLHEDENILFQALRYFSDIDKNRYLIATLFSKESINLDESPRIILIAERLSEDLRRLSTLVIPEVELLEYSSVILPDGDKGIVYHSVSLPTISRPPACQMAGACLPTMVGWVFTTHSRVDVYHFLSLSPSLSPRRIR
jgi:hypothetical protein